MAGRGLEISADLRRGRPSHSSALYSTRADPKKHGSLGDKPGNEENQPSSLFAQMMRDAIRDSASRRDLFR